MYDRVIIAFPCTDCRVSASMTASLWTAGRRYRAQSFPESAVAAQGGVQATAPDAVPVPAGAQTGWAEAANVESDGAFLFRGRYLHLPSHFERAPTGPAIRVPGGDSRLRSRTDYMIASWRCARSTGGIPRRSGMATGWQDRYRDRRPSLSSQWNPRRAVEAGRSTRYGARGVPLQRGWGIVGALRSAHRPAPRPRCHLRPVLSPEHRPRLLGPYSPSTNLVFWCSGTTPDPP